MAYKEVLRVDISEVIRLVCLVLTPISVAAWCSVMCSSSKLLRTWSLVCSLGVNITFSMG